VPHFFWPEDEIGRAKTSTGRKQRLNLKAIQPAKHFVIAAVVRQLRYFFLVTLKF
jgi:hypothetical protein